MSLQPWLMPTWKLLAPRIGRGELPHAVLISGPRGLGKRVLADKLIAAALCEQRGEQGFACASCRACQLLAAGSHPDPSKKKVFFSKVIGEFYESFFYYYQSKSPSKTLNLNLLF